MGAENGELLRQQARKRYYDICEWGLANVIKQHLGLSRAAAEQQVTGQAPANTADLLSEIPIGSTVTINQTAPQRSRLGWILAGAALLGGAAGWAGAALLAPKAQQTIDAVIEWEIPNGRRTEYQRDSGSITGERGRAGDPAK